MKWHLLLKLPLFQIIRRFDFCQSQTALSLIMFVEKNNNFFNQKNIMKIYSTIDLMKLIWYYKHYYIYL